MPKDHCATRIGRDEKSEDDTSHQGPHGEEADADVARTEEMGGKTGIVDGEQDVLVESERSNPSHLRSLLASRPRRRAWLAQAAHGACQGPAPKQWRSGCSSSPSSKTRGVRTRRGVRRQGEGLWCKIFAAAIKAGGTYSSHFFKNKHTSVSFAVRRRKDSTLHRGQASMAQGSRKRGSVRESYQCLDA